ncbi:N-acetylneuraminate synthase [Methanoplanus endosymbiosus]|uniref:N-acetylneuraminate synthase n=1 Tax=Methanoplanus endosymbiosus TaxID=33865 RepID=A0A9E7PNL0_9EURY|nr:N-acetylneuraminate synthase [Methanoplanus endosymbiosus]UUX92259.1 N-acetylneuraminate synthase [Methanoplanus endosymbiosus]
MYSQKNNLKSQCYVIAEAGVNHNGDINLAKKLIDAAKDSGADAVKFQTFKAEEVVCKTAGKAQYQIENTGSSESQYEMIKALELSDEDFTELKKYADEKEITFLSTPFDHQSADFLEKLGVPLFKIPSGEITNIPLLEHIGKKQKPVILSTGMSTLGEVEEAIESLKSSGTTDITLLHCTTSYPAPIESVNLSAMETMRCAFKLPVGYSDHTEGITIPIAAVALGAVVIEKHFTIDKNLPGPDHKASLEPDELKAIVEAVRDVELAMGNGIKAANDAERNNIQVARKSLVARRNINEGSVLMKDDVTAKRPGTGIPPKYFNLIIGKKMNKSLRRDEQINWFQIDS